MTSLECFNTGATYPPVSEMSRINKYKKNDRLFRTKHIDIFGPHFGSIMERLGKDPIKVRTVLNYHQLLTKKIADLVCGEPPIIKAGDKTTMLNDILCENDFDTKLYEAFVDVSRFGNGVLKITDKSIYAVDAKYWFPISEPTNIKQIKHHVLAYPFDYDSNGKPTKLYVEIHNKGTVEIINYELNGNTIGKKLTDNKPQRTGLKDFAVVPLTNLTYSGSYYGMDDYTIINSIVESIMWRISCIDSVLDKHTDPSLSGPSSALEQDKAGGWKLTLGNFFRRESKDDPDVQYITWDGNLESNFKQIDLLLKQLYIISEMGGTFLTDESTGVVSSGTALKLKMVSARIKAQRVVGINSERVKNIIIMLARANGIEINRSDLNIKWKDGIPIDKVEQTDVLSSAAGTLISQKTAIAEYNELSNEEAEEELEQIMSEEHIKMPNTLNGGFA